jgi:hypothetical protein
VAGDTPVLVHNIDIGEDGESCSIPQTGEAIVHLDSPNKHALITLNYGDETLSTEQTGGEDLPTNDVSTFDPSTKLSPTTINVRIQLPNPDGAFAYAEAMLAKTARGAYPYDYDVETQSCVTYCAQVLQAGGISDIPTDTWAATRWLIRQHG